MESNHRNPELLGPNGLIDKTEFVRIILQSLYSLGYTKAAAALEVESGVRLDSPEYVSLLNSVVSGRWDECVGVINSIGELDSRSQSMAAFLIWRQQFLELLGSGDGVLPAKDVLWSRISRLDVERGRIHRLARAFVSEEGVVVKEDRVRRRIGLLLDLVDLLPAWVRVPSGRLEHLVETAVVKQRESCVYHNSPEELTLYEDHACSKENLPSMCVQTLSGHGSAVWCVQFSNKGKYLASSSKDGTAIIWMVREDDTVSLKHTLSGHRNPVSFLSWSPDDTMILTCGNMEVLKLWDVDTGVCKLTFKGPDYQFISSCAWFPNSDKIVCSSYEPDHRIFTCDIEGNELEVWEGERIPKVTDLAVTPDGCCLISVCSGKGIWIRNFQNGKERVLHEEHSITSLSLSRDGQFIIVNLNSEEMHLWKVHGGLDTPERFKGNKQGKYAIRSCFGGSDSLFIASGSEDSQIYIWHRHNEMPIQVLSGHSMTVNCVSWNPTRPQMLASASDDRSIRIWLAGRKPRKNRVPRCIHGSYLY